MLFVSYPNSWKTCAALQDTENVVQHGTFRIIPEGEVVDETYRKVDLTPESYMYCKQPPPNRQQHPELTQLPVNRQQHPELTHPPVNRQQHPEVTHPPVNRQQHPEVTHPPVNRQQHPELTHPPVNRQQHPEVTHPPVNRQQHPEVTHPPPNRQQHPELTYPRPTRQQHPELTHPPVNRQQHPGLTQLPVNRQQHPELTHPAVYRQQHPEVTYPPPSRQQHPELTYPRPTRQQHPELTHPAVNRQQHPELTHPPVNKQQHPEVSHLPGQLFPILNHRAPYVLLNKSATRETLQSVLDGWGLGGYQILLTYCNSSSAETTLKLISYILKSLEMATEHGCKLACVVVCINPQVPINCASTSVPVVHVFPAVSKKAVFGGDLDIKIVRKLDTGSTQTFSHYILSHQPLQDLLPLFTGLPSILPCLLYLGEAQSGLPIQDIVNRSPHTLFTFNENPRQLGHYIDLESLTVRKIFLLIIGYCSSEDRINVGRELAQGSKSPNCKMIKAGICPTKFGENGKTVKYCLIGDQFFIPAIISYDIKPSKSVMLKSVIKKWISIMSMTFWTICMKLPKSPCLY